jgi:hypothetical protein
VFPVWPKGKLPAVEDWENAATRDPDQIRAWWKARPYNLGSAVGRSRIVVVDLGQARGDAPPPGFPGATGGAEVLARLAEAAGQPDPTGTYSVTGPTGGEHRYPEREVLRDIDAGIAYGKNMPRIIRRGRQP